MNPLDRFIRAVQHRWIIVRMIERMGVGVLAGCLVAGALLPILLWRNQSPWSTLIGCVVLGAAGGIVIGWIRRPTRLAAAIEADRQLDQADLLATAYLVPATRPMDEWSAAVRFEAERRCATLSANAIVLHRLGSRAWGGIGLAMALLVTVGLMFSDPPHTRAEQERRAAMNASRDDAPSTEWSARRPNTKTVTPREGSTGASDRPAPATSQRPGDGRMVTEDNRGNRNRSHGDAASGAGSAESDARQHPPANAAARAAPGQPESPAAGIATSAAGAEQSPNAGEGTIDGSVTPSPIPRQPSPWEHPGWPTDQAAAEHALRQGDLPDAYRDVVREYFNPADK